MANEVYNDVWEAVGIKPDKAKSLDIRSDLMIELTDFIEDNEFTQKKAAEFFGVSQPRISNLVHGRLSLFTIDFLVELCVKAGIDVDVSISRKTEEVVEITEVSESEVTFETKTLVEAEDDAEKPYQSPWKTVPSETYRKQIYTTDGNVIYPNFQNDRDDQEVTQSRNFA